MMPLVRALALSDTNAGANGVIQPKSYVVPHLKCLSLVNAMVPLIIPSASCDGNATVNGVT